MPSSNDYDDADIAELMSWFDAGRREVLERNEEAAAELSRLEGPGGFEYLVQELLKDGHYASREEVLVDMEAAGISLERVLRESRKDLTILTADVELMQRAIAEASSDGPPWGVWEETFGSLPTPGLLPVHLAITEKGAAGPKFSFLRHFMKRETIDIGRTCSLSGSILDPLKRKQLQHYLFQLTEWTFDVAQRRGLFLDERRQLTFEALASHPGVREVALADFLSKQRFVTAMEWNVVVDDAIAKARRVIEADTRTQPDEDIVRSAAYGLTAELLEMSPAECERIEGEWRTELESWNSAD